MATVTVQDVTRAGVAATYNAASGGGDKFPPGTGVFIHVKNTSGSAITPTFSTPGQVSGLDIADAVGGTTPATTGERFYGPFPADLFAGADGLVSVSWSAATNVMFAVLRTAS